MKKIFLPVIMILLTLGLMGCQDVRKEFDDFIEEEFIATMQSDYTTAHVYLVEPEKFGVDREALEVNLGSRYSEESAKEAREGLAALYEEFKTFDREKLSDEQKDIYDLYDYQIQLAMKMNDERFDYYGSVFGSMSGIHYQLAVLLADWELRSEQDVKDLILVMEDAKPYVDNLIEFTKKQEEQGLLMIDLDAVIEYCDKILEKGENSAILQALFESVDALELDADAAKDYKEQIRKAFTGSILEAYKVMRDTMEGFKSGKNNEQGLAAFPDGKEYYELLLQQSIGSSKSVEDIRKMMEEEAEGHLFALSWIASFNPEVIDIFGSGEMPETGFKSYEEILDFIQQAMGEDFPEVGALEYDIRDVNEEIASDSGVVAYFMIPALDGDGAKRMRVNPNVGSVSALETYYSVAHEGFPGHMYQYAYAYENLKSPYQKALADVSAYTEGYAVYAQYEALGYLTDLNEQVLNAFKEMELFSYCNVILMDIGIHYDGWTLEEFNSYCQENGFVFSEDELVQQYKQLQANPCAFQPYYVGYHEIIRLKEKAQDALGDDFDNKKFNEALVKSGAVPFSVVERNVDSYIALSQKAAA